MQGEETAFQTPPLTNEPLEVKKPTIAGGSATRWNLILTNQRLTGRFGRKSNQIKPKKVDWRKNGKHGLKFPTEKPVNLEKLLENDDTP